MKKCRTCRYWASEKDAMEWSYGACRRNAPRPDGQQFNVYAWPQVDPDDWCGEHKPRETPNEE